MTFLYDIGRVLLDFDFESSISRLVPPDCDDPGGRMERLLSRKDEFEAGRIPVEEYVNWAIEVLGSDAPPEEFRFRWQRIFTRNELTPLTLRHNFLNIQHFIFTDSTYCTFYFHKLHFLHNLFLHTPLSTQSIFTHSPSYAFYSHILHFLPILLSHTPLFTHSIFTYSTFSHTSLFYFNKHHLFYTRLPIQRFFSPSLLVPLHPY